MHSLTGPRDTGIFNACAIILVATKEGIFQYGLTVLLTDKYLCSLEDYIETLVMLQYNSN